MFRTSMPSRTTRALAAGALIFSLCATTFAGSANASPLGDESHDCSSDAHARNAAAHLLHDKWQDLNSDLRGLASDVRAFQHKQDHEKDSADAAPVLRNDARELVANAKQELKDILSKAREDVRAAIELGTACKDEAENDEDSTAPAGATGSAGSADPSDLDARVKDIVDQAILDMQAVVDEASKAVTEMTTAAESKATTATDVTKVKKQVEKAKADREKAKVDREDAKKADKAKEKAKDAANEQASTKSQNNGKRDAKSGHGRGNERD